MKVVAERIRKTDLALDITDEKLQYFFRRLFAITFPVEERKL